MLRIQENRPINVLLPAAKGKQLTIAPKLPFEYDAAVTALAACIDIDDAKYWANKSDALAAWAKMYRDDKVGRQAKILKLKAYRRIGELAKELRPSNQIESNGKRGKFKKGQGSLLKEHGFTQLQRAQITKIANTSKSKFDELINLPRPPTPNRFAKVSTHPNPEWRELLTALYTFRMQVRKTSPLIGDMLTGEEAITAKAIMTEIAEWFDAFDMRLAKQ